MMQIEPNWEPLRHVKLVWHPEYDIELWDCNERFGDGPQSRCAYRFRKDGCSRGSDYGCSPMVAIDSDEALIGLMGFLTLRPQDTDDEYFTRHEYTPEQLAWAESAAEDLQPYGLDEEEREPPRFIDVHGSVTLTVTLVLTGPDALEEARGVVLDVLDGGALQDAIVELSADRDYDINVASAVCE